MKKVESKVIWATPPKWPLVKLKSILKKIMSFDDTKLKSQYAVYLRSGDLFFEGVKKAPF